MPVCLAKSISARWRGKPESARCASRASYRSVADALLGPPPPDPSKWSQIVVSRAWDTNKFGPLDQDLVSNDYLCREPVTREWTAEQIPDQRGRAAIVTGANSGLGRIVARELARHGARVVVASRDNAKGAEAARAVTAAFPSSTVEAERLDLADLSSIRAFVDRIRAGYNHIDLLINNAGVMAAPYQRTADGFELQLGTNHLGHFALTGLLLPLLNNRPDARVVTVSSQNHRRGQMRFDDLQGEHRYSRWGAYAQSKLANLLFAFELDRRLKSAGWQVISVAAHPGYSAPNPQPSRPPAPQRDWWRTRTPLTYQP